MCRPHWMVRCAALREEFGRRGPGRTRRGRAAGPGGGCTGRWIPHSMGLRAATTDECGSGPRSGAASARIRHAMRARVRRRSGKVFPRAATGKARRMRNAGSPWISPQWAVPCGIPSRRGRAPPCGGAQAAPGLRPPGAPVGPSAPVRGGRSRPGPGPLCAPAQTAPEGEDPLRPGAVVDRYRRAGTGVYGANRAREVGAGFARPGRLIPPRPGGWRLRALTSGAWCARSASPRGEPAEPSGVALTRQGGGDDQERRGSLLRTGEGRGRAEGRTRRTSRSSGSRMNNS